MLISEPYAELYYNSDILKHMEHCGRNCYNSYKNVTDDSCVGFLNRAIDRQHWSVLEHAGIKLTPDMKPSVDMHEVSLCLAAARNAVGGIRCSDALKYGFVHELDDLYKCERDNKLVTFKIVCSRATAAQIDRNRNASISERSFRYCKMDNEDDFTCCWLAPAKHKDKLNKMIDSWTDSYRNYKELLDSGMSADDARYVLPMASETTIYVTEAEYWWKERLKVRFQPGTSLAYLKICRHILAAKPEWIKALNQDMWKETEKYYADQTK